MKNCEKLELSKLLGFNSSGEVIWSVADEGVNIAGAVKPSGAAKPAGAIKPDILFCLNK
jgi:hypothetical protein